MSLNIYTKRQATLRADGSEFGDASMDLEKLQYTDEEEGDYLPGNPPEDYYESAFETTTVRCCGAGCCVLLGVLTLSWIIHAIPVSTITDIPPFARSMIWMSIAHHTDAWQTAQSAYSPPPPAFGDGLGNFPDS